MSFRFLSLERVTTSGKVQKEVDGLRFIAIVPVVLMHAYFVYMLNFPDVRLEMSVLDNLFRNGGTGVHIFFVISGYILSQAFYKAAQRGKQIQLTTYFIRRLQRLEPPYIISLVLFFGVLVFLGKGTFESLIDNFVASVLYLHNIIYGYGSEINNVAWTLEVEFQFYILAPLLYFAYLRKRYSFYLLLILIFIFLSTNYLMGEFYRSILSQGHFFILGALLHLKQEQQQNLVGRFSNFSVLIVAFSLLLALFQFKTISYSLIDNIIKLLLLYIFFVIALKHDVVRRVLSLKWIYLIGGICYSIYLIHYPLLSLFGKLFNKFSVFGDSIYGLIVFWLLASLVVLLASVLFALLFERPFMVHHWPSKFWGFVLRRRAG